MVGFEWCGVPVAFGLFEHWASAPPAGCSVCVLCEELGACALVLPAESACGGGVAACAHSAGMTSTSDAIIGMVTMGTALCVQMSSTSGPRSAIYQGSSTPSK